MCPKKLLQSYGVKILLVFENIEPLYEKPKLLHKCTDTSYFSDLFANAFVNYFLKVAQTSWKKKNLRTTFMEKFKSNTNFTIITLDKMKKILETRKIMANRK